MKKIIVSALAMLTLCAFTTTAVHAAPIGKPVAAVHDGPTQPCPHHTLDWNQAWLFKTTTPVTAIIVKMETPGINFFDAGVIKAKGFSAKLLDPQTVLVVGPGANKLAMRTDFVPKAEIPFDLSFHAFNGSTPVNQGELGETLHYNGSGKGSCANCGTGGQLGYGFTIVSPAPPIPAPTK